MDEIHIVGEGRRGATLETLLCKLLLAPMGPRLIAMSATIGNIDELSNFLKVNEFRLTILLTCVCKVSLFFSIFNN